MDGLIVQLSQLNFDTHSINVLVHRWAHALSTLRDNDAHWMGGWPRNHLATHLRKDFVRWQKLNILELVRQLPPAEL